MCEYEQNTDIENILYGNMYIRIRITGNIHCNFLLLLLLTAIIYLY